MRSLCNEQTAVLKNIMVFSTLTYVLIKLLTSNHVYRTVCNFQEIMVVFSLGQLTS